MSEITTANANRRWAVQTSGLRAHLCQCARCCINIVSPRNNISKVYQSPIPASRNGLYLHADKEKIVRLSRTSESLRFFCTTKYVEEIEAIVLELNDFLKKMNVIDIGEETHLKAPVISFETHGLSGQDIEHSPYWSNMYARDATNDKINALIQKLSENELLILFLASFFIDELKKENTSIDMLKSIVLESTIEQWKDFSEARSLCKSIPDLGISNKVRFNNQKDVAYVHIFPSNVYIITLVKDNSDVPWKIFSLGGNIDPHGE